METLPLEMMEKIGQYLTVQELVTCSATCIIWREAFNCDILWKPRCRLSNAEYLMTTECKVKPGFVSPELENSSLSPICEWRMCFMRENHLWNNWRQGNYVTQTDESQQHSFIAYIPYYHLFVKNDYLLKFFNHRITLWDIRNYPIYLCDPFNLTDKRFVNFSKIFGNKIVVVRDTAVDVFKISFPLNQAWPLCHSFFIDDTIGQPHKNTVLSNKAVRFVYILINNIFIGSCYSQVSLHIWNLDSGMKLKKVDVPESSTYCVLQIVPARNSSMDFLLVVDSIQLRTVAYYVFSLTNMTFFNFKVKIIIGFEDVVRFLSCMMYKNYVVIPMRNQLRFYNYHTSQLVRTVISNSNVVFLDNRFTFIYKNWINLIDITKTCLGNSHLLAGSKNTGDIICVICDKFLVTSKEPRKIQVWAVSNKLKTKEIILLESFMPYNMGTINEACSRMILPNSSIAASGDNSIQIISFW